MARRDEAPHLSPQRQWPPPPPRDSPRSWRPPHSFEPSRRTLALLVDVDKTTCDTRQFQGGTPKIRAGIQTACHTHAGGHAIALISGRTEHRLQNATGDSFPLAARHGRALVLSSREVVLVGPPVDLRAEIRAVEEFANLLNVPFWNDGDSVEIGFQGGREGLKPVVEIFMRHLVQRRPQELQLLPLKKVTEIIPCGVGKGMTLDYFMDNDPRFSDTFVLYFGDDLNDIPAGRAAQRRGGL